MVGQNSLQPSHPSNCSWNLLIHLQQKGSPKTTIYSSVKLYCQWNVLIFRHLPAFLSVFWSFMGTKELHTYGCTTEQPPLYRKMKFIRCRSFRCNRHQDQLWHQTQSFSTRVMSKVEYKQQVLLWLIFKWHSTTGFFNIQFRFLCWIFAMGNCLADSFTYYRLHEKK